MIDDHFVVTELACSVTLAPAYIPHLLERVLSLQSHTTNGEVAKRKQVLVFIVCGGSKGSVGALPMFKERLNSWDEDDIWMDGTSI